MLGCVGPKVVGTDRAHLRNRRTAVLSSKWNKMNQNQTDHSQLSELKMLLNVFPYSIFHVKAVLLMEVVTEERNLHLNVAVGAREVLPPLIVSWIFVYKRYMDQYL
jgi:hypothetical protein